MHQRSTDELAKILWDYNNLHQNVVQSDCILVLGSNDVRVAEKGAEVFLQGLAPLIVFSGNVGRLTKDIWKKSEAETFAEIAIQMRVPKDKILVEDQSTNTGDNILLSKKLLEEKGIAVSRIILVQKPYMQRRAYATFKKVWPDMEVIVTAPDISYEEYPNEIISKELLINILVGDTQRIKVYPEKGFQIPQEIPREVRDSYEELVRRGYTKQLILI